MSGKMCFSLIGLLLAPLAAAAQPDKPVRSFLNQHCVGCHGADKAKANLRLDQQDQAFDGKPGATWERVLAVLRSGEMPPKGKPQPTAAEKRPVETWIVDGFRSRKGRLALRMLTRRELNNTLNDLLGFDPPYDFTKRLPAESVLEGFDNNGEDAVLPPESLANLLEVARFALDQAIVTGEKPPVFRKTVEMTATGDWKKAIEGRVRKYKEQHQIPPKDPIPEAELTRLSQGVLRYNFNPGWFGVTRIDQRGPFLAMFPYIPSIAYPNGSADKDYKGDLYFDTFAFDESKTPVPSEGVFRILVTAAATIPDGKSPPRLGVDLRVRQDLKDSGTAVQRQIREITAPVANPKQYEFIYRYQFNRPDPDDLAKIDPKKPQGLRNGLFSGRVTNEYMMPEVSFGNPQVPFKERFDKGFAVIEKYDWEQLPQVLVSKVEAEVPYYLQWPPRSHSLIFFDSPNAAQPDVYAREIIERFMTRAFRRPVQATEVDAFYAIYAAKRKTDIAFPDAVKAALAPVLVSPGFLFLNQPRTFPQAEQYELASHLAYFLWSSMPDAELLRLAGQGKLADQKVLEAQIERLLADPRSQHFSNDFVRQWLNLLQLERKTVLDPEFIYTDYLRESISQEPAQFFAEMLRNNESVLSALDSDFAVVNDRLAALYGIDGVRGEHFRRVPLPKGHPRGGILGQSAVLIAMTRGNPENRWPIFRGGWLIRTILHENLPDPPLDVPELDRIEAKTQRDLLRLHQEHPSCAMCHHKMDPGGFGMQNFDAIGRWTTKRQFIIVPPPDPKTGKRPKIQVLEYVSDPQGKLPRGHDFADFAQFKQLLLTEYRDDFLRRFTEKLLSYALRRRLDPADQDLVNEMVQRLKDGQYRSRTFVKSLVTSGSFRIGQ